MNIYYPIINETDLPCARLELRWRKEKPHPSLPDCLEIICDYYLIFELGPFDSRHRKYGTAVQKKVRLGRTKVSECYPNKLVTHSDDGKQYIQTPFRDGRHIQWDAHQLNLPAFVVFEGKAQQIQPEPHGD